MNFVEIRQDCATKSELYEDEEFPAEDASIFYHEPLPGAISWKRPRELEEQPQFVIDDRSRFDIEAGTLANPMLVSVLGILYQYRGLFYRAVPADQGFTEDFMYAGVFHFRFWWAGEWTEVIIDDKIPVQNGRTLVFAHAKHSMQFWASLLEKAYAKLHRSYEGIRYASSADMFNELTGAITESLPMSSMPAHALTEVMRRFLATTSIVTAVSKPVTTTGIAANRHYLVLAVEELPVDQGKKETVLKLAVGLGIRSTYRGPWSDERSIEWKSVAEDVRKNLLTEPLQPGEFWISWNDFAANFDRVETAFLDAETCQSERMLHNAQAPLTGIFQGFWQRGVTAGGCRNEIGTFHLNHQVLLGVTAREEILISLVQHQISEPKVIGFSIYKLPNSHSATGLLESDFFRNNKAVFHSAFSNSRSVFGRMELDPGNYVVMPTTYETGAEGTFTLRVYSLAGITLRELDHSPQMLRSPITRATNKGDEYLKAFVEYADEKKNVSAYELQEILHSVLPNDFVKSSATMDVCKKAIQALNPGRNLGTINYGHFQDFIHSLKFWQKVFSSYSKSTTGAIQAEHFRDGLSDIGFQLSTEIMSLVMLKYMRRDGTLRFGDFVAAVLQLTAVFNTFNRKTKDRSDHVELTIKDTCRTKRSCGYNAIGRSMPLPQWAKSVLRC